ncbi:N-acetylmuramoyl-L-alanine amidase [Clostridium sp. Marseille-Q2269]|uniref:N-acetylmuramoyl-L-alanine amidase n=1 Tax=Clostridium sp. Marseille-Q2269 TaxID=2942205 RepID=UPI002072F0E6|nr:N-acetylmuramoyl-L-alanine amidase [Clostridium sp. Marseille-Q2269]
MNKSQKFYYKERRNNMAYSGVKKIIINFIMLFFIGATLLPIKVQASGTTKIMGQAKLTQQQAFNYFKTKNSLKSDQSVKDFISIVWQEAATEGIRADVAFIQMMKETNFLKFTGDVKEKQNNFAGIGATGGGVQGAHFNDVRTGVRAVIQHLKAYCSTEALKNPCVDPRFTYVERGISPYVEWLGIGENPQHPDKGWAADRNYGKSIIAMMEVAKKIVDYPETSGDITNPKITYLNPVNDTILDGENISLKVKSNYNGDVEYKAYIYLEDKGIWEVAADYSQNVCRGDSEKTIILNKKYPEGKYRISVWVRKKGTEGNIKTDLGSYDAYSTTYVNVEKNTEKIKITYLNPVNNTILDGENISLKVKSNYNGDVEYKAYIYLEDKGIWEVAADYSQNVCRGDSEKTIILNKKYPEGKYRISVWVRKKGTEGNIKTDLGSYDAYSTTYVNVDINTEKIKITYLNPVNNTILDGENISLKVKSNYNGDVEYKAYIYLEDKGIWEVAADYSQNVCRGDSEKTIILNKKYPEGKYRISVWVRKKGTEGNIKTDLGSYDAYSTTYVNVKDLKITCIKKKNDFIETSQKQEIRAISNTTNKVQYKVLMQEPRSTQWKVIKDYGQVINGNEEYIINPNINYSKGTYRISVWIKKAGTEGKITNAEGLGKYDNYATISFNVYQPLKISSLNLQKSILNTSNMQNYFISASDGSLVQYKVLINYVGTNKWEVIQNYGEPIKGDIVHNVTPNFKYKPGEYRVSVWVKRYGTEGKIANQQGLGKYDDYKTINFKCVDELIKTIVLDAGHGGKDSGAVSSRATGNIHEADIVQKITLKLGNMLKAQGYNVIYTRDKIDLYNYPSVAQNLEDRVNVANSINADLFLSIHADSASPSAQGHGGHYSSYRPGLDNSGVYEEQSEYGYTYYDRTPCDAALKSKVLSQLIVNELSSLGSTNRGIKDHNLYVTKNTKMPSVLVECGFVSNDAEVRKLNSDSYQNQIAQKLYNAVTKLFSM